MTIATCVLGRLTGPLCDALLGITGSRAMVEEIELRQIFLHELSGERPLSMLTRDGVTVAVTTAWGGRAPATWNRHVATIRSFLGFCQGRRWLAEGIAIDLERRPEPADSTKAIPLAELERLWRREDVKVREKALWRLLHETAARASEALSINVEDRQPTCTDREGLASGCRSSFPSGRRLERLHRWSIML